MVKELSVCELAKAVEMEFRHILAVEANRKEQTMIDSDIRTETLLKLADHMKSINKTMIELNKEVEEMMQDIMRDLKDPFSEPYFDSETWGE